MLNEISQIVKDLIGNEYLYFDEALQIKTSPHTFPVNLWAVCVNPNNSVYVMDGQENWFPLSEKDEIVIQSLYQRVQMIASKYKTAI